MAEFSIRDVEGMRQIRISIADETVRARRGAMSNLRGQVRLIPRLPGLGDMLRSGFTREGAIRPHYEGTGEILLQPSHGGYHLLDITLGERWILEPGVFWACEGSVRLGMTRDPFFASLWAGDGFLNWKTTLSGSGRAAINTPGPVETVEIEDAEMRVQGRLVLGRTDGLSFSSQRPAGLLRSGLSGQSRLRVFKGTGKLLVCWTPYWNEKLLRQLSYDEDEE